MNKIADIQPFKMKVLISLLLILAILVVYMRVGRLDFVDYDDPIYITENREVNNGLTVDSLVWAFKTFHASNWHPLTWLSHMMDCELYGSLQGDPHPHDDEVVVVTARRP